MSGLVNNPAVAVLLTNDLRLSPEVIELAAIGTNVALADFVTPWWPGSGGLFDSADGGTSISAVNRTLEYPNGLGSGAESRYGFVGVTRDQYGSPVGSVTLLLFLASTNTLIDQTISDSTGAYLLNTPYYPNTHYIVLYKLGSPNVSGASPPTLIGT